MLACTKGLLQEGRTSESTKTSALTKREAYKSINRFIAYPLIFLPAALALLYIHLFGVNFPFYDDWELVPLFGKLSSGTLNIADLWSPHNDHRQFFARIAMLMLGIITKYNTVAEMYLIWVCFLITLVVLLLAFKISIKSNSKLLLFVPASVLVFSLRQRQNFLHGWEVSFAFSITFGVLALYLLYSVKHRSSKKLAFLAALGSATVASFSTAQGLFVWPAGLLQLFMLPLEKRTKKVLVGAWCLIGAAEWIVYFLDWSRPSFFPPVRCVLDNPLAGIEFFLTLLGGSLFGWLTPALISGSLLVGLTGVGLLLIYRDRKLGEYSFWIALLCFSFLILVSITVGRAGFGANLDELGEAAREFFARLEAINLKTGIRQALISRYTSFSLLAVISIYVMLVKLVSEKRSKLAVVLLVTLSGLVLFHVPSNFSPSITSGMQQEEFRKRAAFILATYESQPDEFLEEYQVDTWGQHPPEILGEYVPTLERLGYSVFSEKEQILPPPLSALSPVSHDTSCDMEIITGSFITKTILEYKKNGKLADHLLIEPPHNTETNAEVDHPPIVISKEESFIDVTGWAVDDEAKDVAGGVYVDVDGELFPAFYGIDTENRKRVGDLFESPSYRYSGFERAIPLSEIGTGSHNLSIIVLTNDRKRYYRPEHQVTLEIE